MDSVDAHAAPLSKRTYFACSIAAVYVSLKTTSLEYKYKVIVGSGISKYLSLFGSSTC